MFKNAKKILVVCAHADDEVLGCGGTLAKAISLGIEVSVMFIGEGVSARFKENELRSIEFLSKSNQRNNEMCDALNCLGIKLYSTSNRLCTQFDRYPLLEIVKEIEKAIDAIRPDIILTHNESEVNIDHGIVYRAVEVAARPIGRKNKIAIYSFEIVCSGNFKFCDVFAPNVYVDIKDFWEEKMRAWSCYAGETQPFPFPRSQIGLETLARYRGMQCGVEMAEAFRLERMLVH
jgi:LmbE family N-acetylglucosaminyl deacetylase